MTPTASHPKKSWMKLLPITSDSMANVKREIYEKKRLTLSSFSIYPME